VSVVGLSGSRTYVVADIPGIIEGAHAGKGLGLRFLRHVERTRVLAYLLPLDAEDPQNVYEQLRREVASYSEELAHKPHVVVLTKSDLLPEGEPEPVVNAPDAAGTFTISSVAGTGLEDLQEFLWRFVEAARREAAAAESEFVEPADDDVDAAWFDPDSGDDGTDDDP
jgi:GTP-binding protein